MNKKFCHEFFYNIIFILIGLRIDPSARVEVLEGSDMTFRCVSLVPSVPIFWASDFAVGPKLQLTSLTNTIEPTEYCCRGFFPFSVDIDPLCVKIFVLPCKLGL